MFQFPRFPLPILYIQIRVTGHYPRRVSPFGNLRFKGCQAPSRSLSQPTTSFIGILCQGILYARLSNFLRYDSNKIRINCAIDQLLVSTFCNLKTKSFINNMPFVLSKSARKNRLDVFTSQIVKLQNSKTHPYIKCCLDGLSLRQILLIFTSFLVVSCLNSSSSTMILHITEVVKQLLLQKLLRSDLQKIP